MLHKPHRRITAAYLVFALLWILFSDSVLYFFGIDEALIPGISMVKGFAYVFVTSTILYLYMRHEFGLRYKLEAELREQMEQAKRSQAALEESERRFRTAVEHAPLPMMIFAEDGEILAISRAWLEITGYSAEQLKTLGAWMELAYGERKTPVIAMIDTLFDMSERIDEGEFTINCRDGSQRIWEFSSTPLGKLPDQRRIVVSIAKDMTDQKQAEANALEFERLKAGFQQEQERIALVQRIMSALSHDLRTPLTVISTSRDTLSHYFDKLTPEKRLEKLEAIGREAQFALELLEDTVNMVRGNLTETAFHPVPLNLASLCQVSVDEVRAAKDGHHRLSFSNLSSTEIAVVDDVLVSRILLNLLSNAIKYSPDLGDIRLELDRRDEWIILRVIDHGLGISDDELPHIFDPFFRSAAVNAISGTGLGLSIVKDCVERHRGRISVKSTLGQGSTFTVELPYLMPGVARSIA